MRCRLTATHLRGAGAWRGPQVGRASSTRAGSARPVAGVAGVALVAGLLVPLVATPATAADTALLVVAGDADRDGSLDVTVRDSAGTVVRTLFAGDNFSFVDHVTTSPDGQRVAYVVSQIGFTAEPTDELVVQDVSGRNARVVARHASNDSVYNEISRPSFSPDGASIAYPLYTEPATGNASMTVRKAAVAAGGTSLVAGSAGAQSVAWTSASEMLVVHISTGLSRLPVSGGASPLVKVTSAPGDEFDLVASPVPGQIALVRAVGATGVLETARYADGALSSRVQVSSGGDDGSPSFSRDGATVFFSRCTDCIPHSDVWSAPATGPASEAAPVFATSGRPEHAVDVVSQDDVAPGAVTMGAATLSGTSARIPVSPADPDLSGVLVTRTLSDGTVQKTEAYLPVIGASFTDTGLLVGKTYSYVVKPVDRSGNIGPASAAKSLTATAVRITTSDPTSSQTAKAPFAVSFGTGNATTTLYDAHWRKVGGTFAPWVTNRPGASRTFGTPAATGLLATTSSPGSTYQFAVKARDAYGNATATGFSGKAVVPYDQSRASFTGTGLPATSAVTSDKWLGTTRALRGAGQRATLPTLAGDRFSVIGERSTSGGTFDVYRGSTRVATKVSTYATSRRARAVLWTSPVAATTASYSVRWVPSGVAGRTNVVLDGFAVRR